MLKLKYLFLFVSLFWGCADDEPEQCISPSGIYRFAASDLGGSCPADFVAALLAEFDKPENEYQELDETECGPATGRLPPPETSNDGKCPRYCGVEPCDSNERGYPHTLFQLRRSRPEILLGWVDAESGVNEAPEGDSTVCMCVL